MFPVDRKWPVQPPTNQRLKRTRQIRYMINFQPEVNRPGLIDVWAYNVLDRTKYHWRWLPASYTDHFLSLNYRFNLYFGVLDRIVVGQHVSNIKELDNLKKYIGYLENVMDAVWEEVRDADGKDMLTPTWRSNAFDLWLVKENVIRRHDERTVVEFRKSSNNAENGFPLDEDALELGKHGYALYRVHSIELFTDWTDYNSTMDDWHTGTKYDHDYPSMTNGDLDDVVAKLLVWISNAPNEALSSDQEGEFELTSFYDQLQITRSVSSHGR